MEPVSWKVLSTLQGDISDGARSTFEGWFGRVSEKKLILFPPSPNKRNPQKNVRPETPAEGREQSCVWSLFQQHSSHLRVAKSYTAPAYLSSPSGTLASSIPSYYHIALFPPCLHITIVTLQRIASRQSSHKQIISSLNSKTQISFHLLSSRHVKANTIFL